MWAHTPRYQRERLWGSEHVGVEMLHISDTCRGGRPFITKPTWRVGLPVNFFLLK